MDMDRDALSLDGFSLAFGVLNANGRASMLARLGAWGGPSPAPLPPVFNFSQFDGTKWITLKDDTWFKKPSWQRYLDLDGDGVCERLDLNGDVLAYEVGKGWRTLPFRVPADFCFFDGVRDLVFSNEKEYGVYLFVDMQTGWKKVRAGKAEDADAIPMIAKNGKNNGCFVHSGHLWWANEDTALMKNHVDRRSFKELLQSK
jgi:hypothetical protein